MFHSLGFNGGLLSTAIGLLSPWLSCSLATRSMTILSLLILYAPCSDNLSLITLPLGSFYLILSSNRYSCPSRLYIFL